MQLRRAQETAGWWVDTAWKGPVTPNICKSEPEIWNAGIRDESDSLLSILLPEDGINGNAISMSSPGNKTLRVPLHEIFCLCHMGLIECFFLFLHFPTPTLSLSFLSPEAYSLWKCISFLGNLNVIFFFFMSGVWCSIQLIYGVVRNSCHDWWNRRLYYDFYIHLCRRNTCLLSLWVISWNIIMNAYAVSQNELIHCCSM